MLEFCQFRSEEIGEAIEGMEGLQEILVPVLQTAVGHGNGTEQDIQQFQRHVMLAKHALVAMGGLLEGQMERVPLTNIDREVWMAEWVKHDGYTECSKCEYWYDSPESEDDCDRPAFCPSCGRAMTPDAWAELKKRLTGDTKGAAHAEG